MPIGPGLHICNERPRSVWNVLLGMKLRLRDAGVDARRRLTPRAERDKRGDFGLGHVVHRLALLNIRCSITSRRLRCLLRT